MLLGESCCCRCCCCCCCGSNPEGKIRLRAIMSSASSPPVALSPGVELGFGSALPAVVAAVDAAAAAAVAAAAAASIFTFFGRPRFFFGGSPFGPRAVSETGVLGAAAGRRTAFGGSLPSGSLTFFGRPRFFLPDGVKFPSSLVSCCCWSCCCCCFDAFCCFGVVVVAPSSWSPSLIAFGSGNEKLISPGGEIGRPYRQSRNLRRAR